MPQINPRRDRGKVYFLFLVYFELYERKLFNNCSRSQSGEKSERPGRAKKKAMNGVNSQQFSNSTSVGKRTNRTPSQHPTPPPQQPGAFSSISQNQIKDSPPSSPSSESQGGAPASAASGRRVKGRKSAPASTSGAKDSKDNIKL